MKMGILIRTAYQCAMTMNSKVEQTTRTVSTDGIYYIVAAIHSSSSEMMTLGTAGQYLQKSHTHVPVPQQLYLIKNKTKQEERKDMLNKARTNV